MAYSQLNEQFESVNKNINTIQELEALYYGCTDVAKVDDPFLTSTTGANNDVYGAEVWNALNETAKTWQMLPKKPYKQAGWRIKTARGVTLGGSGVAENGVIPDTVKPTYVEVALTLKQILDSYDGSLLKNSRSNGTSNDDLTLDQVRNDIGEEHVRGINKMLLEDVDEPAGDNFESIDRVASNQAESALLSAPTDNDIYGLDRSASTDYDAYVDDNGGVARALTKGLINTAIRTIEKNSGERPNVMLTGPDTAEDIDALFEDQGRVSYERISVGVNGVQTGAGNDVMLEVAMIKGIPLIVDSQAFTEASGKQRLYFLNTSYLWIEVARPTKNIETTEDQMLLLGRTGVEGAFITVGELKCTRFSAQGKIRDLS